MLPLRYASRWRFASIMLLMGVMAGALMPAVWFWQDRGDLVSWFVHADKWLHGLIFALLAIWFAGQYRRRSYWRIGLGLIAFGALIELCQSFVTYRSAEWLDMIADVAGIAVGLGVALTGLGGWSVWIENRMSSAKVGVDVG